jgi:hypothetical protein
MSPWVYVGAVTVAVAVTWVVCRMLERPPGRHVMDERVWYLADAVVKPPPPLAELYPGDDLMGVADAVAEPSCGELWADEEGCAKLGPHACALIGGHRIHWCVCSSFMIEPAPTLREESIQPPYGSRRLVRVGNALVHAGCLDARKDAASDWVCERCGRAFGSVTTV